MPRPFRHVLYVNPPLWVPPRPIDQPPMGFYGALLGAAALQRLGAPVRLVDAFPEAPPARLPDGWIRLGPPVERFLAGLDVEDADLVVIHHPPLARLERNLAQGLAPLLAGLARPGRTLVLADGYLSDTHYVALEPRWLFGRFPELDFHVAREPEHPLGALWQGRGHPRLLGRRGTAKANGRPTQVARWDGVPDGVDVARYVAWLREPGLGDLLPGRAPARGIFPYLASRGCPFQCTFCTSEPGRRWAALPVAQVREELAGLAARGVEEIWLLDPIANANPRRFGEVLGVLEDLGLRLVVCNGLRADRLDEAVLAQLARVAGRVPFSVESGDPAVLEGLGKRLSLATARRTLEQAADAGLATEVHYLIGAPGEDAEATNRTLALALEARARWGAEPLVQFHVPPGRLAVPTASGQGLADDFYDAFDQRPLATPGAAPPEQLVRFMDTFRRKLGAGDQAKLIINLTYRCVNRCVFCSVGDRPPVDGALEDQLRALEVAARDGIRLLDLDGGEPTLHPALLQVIDRARELGFQRITVTTNGRRLDDGELVAALAARGVDLLISLHGPTASVHDALTGVEGSHAETWAGIRRARRRLPGLGVNTTVVAENLAHLPALAECLVDAGVRRWNVQLLTPFGRAEGRADLAPPWDDAIRALQELLAAWGHRLEIQVVGLPPCGLEALEQHALDDHHKAVRQMLFATGDLVNLGAYLDARRGHDERCVGCDRRLLCGGMWRFDPGPPAPAPPALTPAAAPAPGRDPGEGPHREAPALPPAGPVRMLDLIPGYACNLVCDYCSVSESMRRVEMRTAEVLPFLHEGRARGIDYVSFGGGEPTIRRDIFQLTRAASRLGYATIRYQTNGFLFAYPEFTARAVAAGLNRVHISLMTSQEALYDRITGYRGARDLVLKGLRNLQAREIPVAGDLILKSDTFGHLRDTVAYFHEHGVTELYLWLVSLTDGNRLNVGSLRPIGEMRPYVEEALDYGREHGIRVMSRHIPPCLLPGHEDQVVRLGDEDVWVVTPRSSFWLLESVISANRFGPRCEGCSRQGVCWGLRQDYLERYGDAEVVPYPPEEAEGR